MTQPHSDDLKQEIVGVYDRAASSYEQVGIKAAACFGNRLIEGLPIPPGAHILDVATGRGALLFPAAHKVGPEGKVIGIDLAPAMLAATAAEISSRGLAQAEVRRMDGDHPDFPEQSFDLILCGFALHFLDFPRALPIFLRLLKSGGMFATVGPYVPKDGVERWQWLFQLTREVFPPGFEPPSSWTAPNRLNTPALITAELREAGFVEISVWREEKVLYFRDEEDWWDWEWSQASRFWLEGMSPEGLAKFKTVSFEKLRQMRVAEGIPICWGAQFATAKSPQH